MKVNKPTRSVCENKSGIYRWVNNVNGKCYVGSAVDLSKRFRQYYTISHLIHPTRCNMVIYKSI